MSESASKQSTKTEPWSAHRHFAWLNSECFDKMLQNLVADAFDERSRECLRFNADVCPSPHSSTATRLHYSIKLFGLSS